MTRQWSEVLFQHAVVAAILLISLCYSQNNRLHTFLPESDLLKYQGKAYVRIYQTVFQATEGASETIFPTTIKYKDIWQDVDGRIIIVPGASLENPTWVGIGDPRNQLKFIHNYKNQISPSENPLVRSFLVEYETVRKILMPNRIATEDPKYNGLDFSVNVDKHAANQFGLNHIDTDELRKNALPESLVTYTSKPVDESQHKHWGTIQSIEKLYDKLGLPSEDIPGSYSDTQTKDRVKGSQLQIDNHLEDLDQLYQKLQSGINVEIEIQGKLKEFNDKYVFEQISERDLPMQKRDLKFEKQKLQHKLEKQIANFEKELKELKARADSGGNVQFIEVENKVNEYNEMYRNKMSEKLSPGEIPTVKHDVKAMQTQLLGDIEVLNELHARSVRGENVQGEIDSRLRKYNKYMMADGRELKTTDLAKIKSYTKEAKTRRRINDRFYNNINTLDPQLKHMDELHWDKTPQIETDHMFTGGKDINMYELQQKSVQCKKRFEQGKKFLAYSDAYSSKLNEIMNTDSSNDFNNIRKLKNSKELLADAFQDKKFVRKIKHGFFYGTEDFSDGHVSKLLNVITEKVTEQLPDGTNKLSFTRKMKSFSDKVAFKPQPMKYNSEIIIQLGSSNEVTKASTYLSDRYKREGKNVIHLINDANGLYQPVAGRISTDLDDTTRISVIGHGENSNSHLSIGGKDPVALAKDLKILFPKSNNEKVTLGKISLIACNVKENEAVKVGSRFGQTFAELLDNDNIQSLITVRVGELQVSGDGFKLYGEISDHHYRNKPPVFVKKTVKEGNVITEYGIIDMKKRSVKWNTKVPEQVENTKLLILSETFGSIDISDIVEKTNLKRMKFVDESIQKSGTLNFQEQDIILDFDEKSQHKRAGIYLDMDTPTDTGLPLVDETGIQSVLMEVDAAVWVDKLSVATSEAIQTFPDTEDWIPLIDTAELDNQGNTKVNVLNLDTFETKSIEMKNDAFVQFKKRSKLHATSVRNLPKLTKATIGMAGTGSLLGFGGFIMSAIQLSKAKKCEANVTCPATEIGRKLAKSLEVNGYVGFAMGTYGLISDSVQIAELAVAFKLSKNAVNGIATMTKTTSKFLQFSKVFGSVGMGVGAVGSVVSLGFSAYHLAHAETKAQKIEFGIQLGVDSVNLVVTGVAIGASITAAVTSSAVASSIASAAGPVGLVVAVVGILTSVITSLTFEFKRTRNGARQVGEYFYILDDVYGQSAFNFNSSSKTFRILDHAIVTTVDFEDGSVQLDSQYIYRTKHGRTGSGKSNYFFWYKDFPKMINNKYAAINIRRGIGHKAVHRFYTAKYAETLILPAIPKSYISYEYSRLPFCTAMHDRGFDIIRRLEQDDRFDYDFYIAPGEQIVSSISHEYVSTTLTVKLTSNVKTIAVPDISNNKYNYLHNKYIFKLITKSVKHTILLQDYYTFYLERVSVTPCSWYLSYDSVDFNEVSFGNSGLVNVGNIKIHVSKSQDTLYILDGQGGTLVVNPNRKTKTLAWITQDSTKTSGQLKSYLKSMNRNWLQSQQQHVVIAQFKHNGVYIGRAFYDIKSERFLYTNLQDVRVSKKFKDNVQLLGFFESDVYFMSDEGNSTIIWRTHAKTARVEASYLLYCGNRDFQISKLSVQGNSTYLIQNVYDVSLIYMMHANEIKLIFIEGQKDNMYKLADSCFPTLNEFLPRNEKQMASLPFPGECVYATTVPILPLKQTLTNGVTRHFWLYMNDSKIGEKSDVFCTPSKPPIATGIISPHIQDECGNLTLRDIQLLHSGEEVYFFYCEGDKNKFYYQVKDNASIKAIVPGEIERIEDFGAIKLIKSKNGGFYKFTETQNFTLAALAFNSIAFQGNWKEAFKVIANQALVETFIPILNMKNMKNKDLTAWYDPVQDRLIIVSPFIEAENIVYLGTSPSSYFIWLYNPNERQVILQNILDDEEISQMIVRSNSEAFWKDDDTPSARIVISDVNSVEYMQGSIFVVTKEGVMIIVDYLNAITFVGVNMTWISNNGQALGVNAERLCNEYKSQNLITMGKQSADSNYTTHMWYHCGMKTQLALNTKNSIQPVFLGISQTEQLIFFFFGEDIIEVDVNNTKEVHSEGLAKAKVKNAMVRGKTLLLMTQGSLLLNDIPRLDHVKSLVIGTAFASEVIIEADDWFHYENIFVTSVGTSGPQLLYLNIHPPYHCSYQFDQVENDTVIKDPISERVIVLEDFTIHYDKSDEDYFPEGNEAVVSVQICDKKPVTLVTNRERFDPMVSRYIASDTFLGWDIGKELFICIITVTVGGLFIAIFVMWKYRKRTSHTNKSKRGNAATSDPRIQISTIEGSNETSI